MVLVIKNLPANLGDIRGWGSLPALGRSPGGGHDNPLLYSFLENPLEEKAGELWSTGSQRVRCD